MIYLMVIVYAGNVFISCAPCKEIMNKIIMFCEWKKTQALWKGMERHGKVWEGMGRCGKVRSGAKRCGEIWKGYRKIQNDTEKYRKI